MDETPTNFGFTGWPAKLNEYLKKLSNLERVKEYRYPVMIIHTDDYEEVTESFIRVNSKVLG